MTIHTCLRSFATAPPRNISCRLGKSPALGLSVCMTVRPARPLAWNYMEIPKSSCLHWRKYLRVPNYSMPDEAWLAALRGTPVGWKEKPWSATCLSDPPVLHSGQGIIPTDGRTDRPITQKCHLCVFTVVVVVTASRISVVPPLFSQEVIPGIRSLARPLVRRPNMDSFSFSRSISPGLACPARESI